MANKKTSELTVDASPALTDYAVVVTDPGTTPVSGLTLLSKIKTLFNVDTYRICGFVSNPQAVYAQRAQIVMFRAPAAITITDRKSTRLNSSHITISYAVFCLK